MRLTEQNGCASVIAAIVLFWAGVVGALLYWSR